MIDEGWELLRVPPAEFVAARDELARRLRAEKRKDEAAEIKALRRPAPTLWALNQLGVADPDGLDEFEAAVSATRAAQEAGAGVKEADARLRAAVSHLSRSAVQLLTEREVTVNPSRQEIESALRTAVGDHGMFESLRSGRLLEISQPVDELAMWSVGSATDDSGAANLVEPDADDVPVRRSPDLVGSARRDVEDAARRVQALQRQVEAALEELASARARLAELEQGS